ncbi:MAG TPA: EsaB/YukD family protein [Candidatus Dormibacteraeota bacterium]|nr:EsaB/YukD family protein [Candidatus Dormibacteraeota bacterium]
MVRPPASLSRPRSGDLCHVSVQASRRRVDLALPASVPILEFAPVLATLCQATGGEREATPPAWTLARPAGPAFELTSTLASESVLDGEVLHLVDAAVWRAPSVADLADAVTEVLEGGRRWTGQATAWLCAGAAPAALLLAALAAIGSGMVNQTTGVVALVAAGALAGSALLVPEVGRRRQAQVAMAAAAAVLAGLGGWAMAGAAPAGGPVAAGLSLAVALLVLSPVVPSVGPGGALAAGVLAVALAAETRGAGAAQVAAVAAVAGVIALRLWPALVGSGLSALVAGPNPAAAEEAARRSRRLLASLSGGTALVLLLASLALLASATAFAAGLAAAVGVALLLRAQAYRFLADALPPALAGVAVLLALEGALAVQGRQPLAVALPAATATALIALAAVRAWPSPPLPGTRLAWLAVDVSLAPLGLGTLGVFGLVAQLVHRFVH